MNGAHGSGARTEKNRQQQGRNSGVSPLRRNGETVPAAVEMTSVGGELKLQCGEEGFHALEALVDYVGADGVGEADVVGGAEGFAGDADYVGFA